MKRPKYEVTEVIAVTQQSLLGYPFWAVFCRAKTQNKNVLNSTVLFVKQDEALALKAGDKFVR